MAEKATEFIFDAMEVWPPSNKTIAKIALELIERGSTEINTAGALKGLPVNRNTNSRQKQFAMQLQPTPGSF